MLSDISGLVFLFYPRNILLYYVSHLVLAIVVLGVQVLQPETLIELGSPFLFLVHFHLLQMVLDFLLITEGVVAG